jgi:SAM-dependent methyltransferase
MANISMTKSDWGYRGLVAECYDLWFGDEPFWDQAFFHDRIRRNGGVALEIACGTGRLLVPFLRDGLAVQGMDASDEMLAICRTKAARVGVTPTLYHQLMQDLDLAPHYHTLFIPACSFLTHEATVSDRIEQVQHISLRYEVFKEGSLVQTQLRTHRLRWYHRHEFAMMLESVGFREVAMQCGYTASDTANPEAEWVFIAKR